jgi:putative sigma-54 modulation protein
MKLRITGRHMNITPALREYVDTRFERLDRYGLKVTSLQVVLGVEKLQHKAEVVGTVNGKRVQAKTSTREMYATIDALVARVDAQLRKWKERLVEHKPSKMKRIRPSTRLREKWGSDQPSRVERQAVPLLSIAEAEKQFHAEGSTVPYLLFVNADNGRVHLVQRGPGGRLAIIEPYSKDSSLQ